MSVVASDFINSVRYRHSDYTDQSYGNALMLEYINDGSKDFAESTGCCQHIATVTPDGTNSYINLSTGNLTYRFINIYAVEYGDTVLDFAPLHQIRHATPAAGTPSAWSVWTESGAERMYFDAIPPASSNVTIYMTYIPDDLSAVGNNIGLPDKWIYALKCYCDYRIHEMNREEGLAVRSYQEYEKLKAMAATINESLMSRGGYSR